MISRFLVAIVAGFLVLGSTDARAQKATGTGGDGQPDKATEDRQEPGTLGGDSSSSRVPAATRDPFDAAAAKLKVTDGKDAASGSSRGKTEKATFGAGCFWHVESEFEWLPGVKSAVSGYSGGSAPYPSYEEVHEGVTGHAEVVQVEYDPEAISYEQLLKVFWSGHDPTQLNRQGPDEGTQYRSVIFYHTPEQREAALKSYRQLTAKKVFPRPIVTQLLPMQAFYRAEDYHQNYYGGKDDRPAARGPRSKRVRKPAAKPAAVKAGARSSASAKPAPEAGGPAPVMKANPDRRAPVPAEPES